MPAFVASGPFLLLLAMLPACSSTGTPAPDPGSGASSLEGTAWTLTALNGRSALPNVTVSLSLAAGGRLAGSDGCNRYLGAYHASGTTLTLTPGGSTMMACPDAIMEQARTFAAALSGTRTYALEADRLVLRDDAGKPLATFGAMQPLTLPGTRWTATAVNNGRQAVVSLAEGTEITAEFAADQTLTGSAGCNRYTARYELHGDALTIHPPALTRRACLPAVMQQEQEYVAALERSATFRLDADRLELRSAGGSLQVTYRPAP